MLDSRQQWDGWKTKVENKKFKNFVQIVFGNDSNSETISFTLDSKTGKFILNLTHTTNLNKIMSKIAVKVWYGKNNQG